jgi:hypothetical protein
MAAKILKHREVGDSIVIQVHLDDSKTIKDGDKTYPDPAFVREWTWAKDAMDVVIVGPPGSRRKPNAQENAAYRKEIIEEVKRQVKEERKRLGLESVAGTALSEEGKTF